MDCLSENTVLALVEGRLAVGDREVERHLDACDACRELVVSVMRDQSMRRSSLASSTAQEPADRLIAPGTTIGRYRLLELLGVGAMGAVYAALDERLDRRVAVKVLRAPAAPDDQLSELRLILEARAMARLSHPNVVEVYDVGAAEGRSFVAMKLIDGMTLRAWLRERPRSTSAVLAVFLRAGAGLSAAHAVGLVHRDFKPENVLIDRDGQAFVTDFGLARGGDLSLPPREPDGRVSDSPAVTVTRTGALVGTPAYMAPEQLAGRVVDARADIFSFAVALHEALFGERPFRGNTIAALREAIERGDLVSPPSSTRVPARIQRALARALRARPEERWPSMDALLVALDPPATRLARSARRWGPPLLVASALVGGVLAWRGTRSPAPPVSVRAVRRVTFGVGCESYPSFTPDGRTVIHDAVVDGYAQVFALDLASGAERQLTRGPGNNGMATLSPDGQLVAYLHYGDGARELQVIATDGAPPVRHLGPSPSGGRTWLSGNVLAAAAGAKVVSWDLSADPPRKSDYLAAPDGIVVGLMSAFIDGEIAVDWVTPPELLGVGVMGRKGLRVLVDKLPYEEGVLAAAPSQDAVYYVRRTGAVNELVRTSRDGRESFVVPGGIAPSGGMAISRDGKQLAFATCRHTTRLVQFGADEVPTYLSDRGATWRDKGPAAVDAQHVMFLSDRSSSDQLFLLNTVDRTVRALTGPGISEGDLSPDGKQLVYTAPGGLVLLALDGSAPRPLTERAGDNAPTFSRDGTRVVFLRLDEAHVSQLHVVPTLGGPARAIAPPGSSWPAVSRADDRVVYLRRENGQRHAMITDLDGAEPQALVPALPAGASYWAPSLSRDGRRLILVRDGNDVVELTLGVEGSLRRIVHSKSAIESAAYAWDDHSVMAAVDASDGDLWLADGEFR